LHVNESKLILIQDIWSRGNSFSCGSKGIIMPKFYLKIPGLTKNGSKKAKLAETTKYKD
jgi:hypothetical protein